MVIANVVEFGIQSRVRARVIVFNATFNNISYLIKSIPILLYEKGKIQFRKNSSKSHKFIYFNYKLKPTNI